MAEIDVALATYNGAAFVEPFLASLKAQQDCNLSLIVSDDHSTDGTRSLVADCWPGAKVFVNDGQKGAVGNFDSALSATTARYVALADQDDVWVPGKLATLAKVVVRREAERHGPILVFSDLAVVDRGLGVIHHSFFASGRKSIAASRLSDFVVSNHVPGCSMMVNRALLDLALPIPPTVMMHDWWLALVAATFGTIDHVDDALVLYRQHGGNTLGAPGTTTGAVSRWMERLRAPGYRLADYRRQAGEARRTLVAFRDRYAAIMPSDAARTLRDVLDRGPLVRWRILMGAHTGEVGLKAFIQSAMMQPGSAAQ